MPDPTLSEAQSQPLSEMLRIDEECLRFEAAWKAGECPRVEEYLSGSAEPRRTALLRELLPLELSYRRARGQLPSLAEYGSRFPEHLTLLAALFETQAQSAP